MSPTMRARAPLGGLLAAIDIPVTPVVERAPIPQPQPVGSATPLTNDDDCPVTPSKVHATWDHWFATTRVREFVFLPVPCRTQLTTPGGSVPSSTKLTSYCAPTVTIGITEFIAGSAAGLIHASSVTDAVSNTWLSPKSSALSAANESAKPRPVWSSTK